MEIRKKLNSTFITIACFAAVIVALSGFLIYISFPSNSDRGAFGDMFGMINSLFSGLLLRE